MKTKMAKPYKEFFAIHKQLTSLGDVKTKDDLVEQFTVGRTNSLRQLNDAEYQALIANLNQRLVHFRDESYVEDKKNKVRRKIIALFCKMDWKTPKGAADMERIECWAIKYGQFHKRLNAHNLPEITKLCTQVEKVYASFIETL